MRFSIQIRLMEQQYVRHRLEARVCNFPKARAKPTLQQARQGAPAGIVPGPLPFPNQESVKPEDQPQPILIKPFEVANHASARTTQLYDRRAEEVTFDEERVLAGARLRSS